MRHLGPTLLAAAMALIVMAASAVGALKEKSSSTTITSAEEFDSTTAKCKRGSTAVSGGFEGSAYQAGVQAQVLPVDSFRAGKRKWTAAGAFFSDAGATSGDLTTYAYCDDSRPRLKTKSSSTTLAPSGSPDAIGSATAKCKRGSVAISGGFDSSDS